MLTQIKFRSGSPGKRMKWLASLLVHEAKRRSQPDVGNLANARDPFYLPGLGFLTVKRDDTGVFI